MTTTRDITLRAIVFDFGETILDETRAWEEWADWLNVPRLTLMAVLGGVIARGEPHQRAFELLRPGFDLQEALAERTAAGRPHRFLAKDLYPDARPCLEQLKADGYVLGVAGNHTAEAESFIRDLDLPLDFVGSSERWGAEKPSPGFFDRLVNEAIFPPQQVGYVGDRVDNDVAGAAKAGLTAILLHRGPWAILLQDRPEAKLATLNVRSLEELPQALRNRRGR